LIGGSTGQASLGAADLCICMYLVAIIEFSNPFRAHQVLLLSLKTMTNFTSVVMFLSVAILRFHLLLSDGLGADFGLDTFI
jgi:hypothetical protein